MPADSPPESLPAIIVQYLFTYPDYSAPPARVATRGRTDQLL